MKTGKRIDNADVHIGRRVRVWRMLRGITQTTLGRHLGITFQQMQKYEKGKNRISAGRLWRIAQFLKVDIAHFYEGLSEAIEGASAE